MPYTNSKDRAIYIKAWRKRNREKCRAADHRYWMKHRNDPNFKLRRKISHKISFRKYYLKNKTSILKRTRQYFLKHVERKNELDRKRYKQDPRIKARVLEWARKHPERSWSKVHPERRQLGEKRRQQNLYDSYIKKILYRSGIPRKIVTNDIIKLKHLSISLLRERKRLYGKLS